MSKSSSYPFQIALIVSLGGFLFGFDASVISGVVEFVGPQFDLDDIQLGWVVSSPTFAAMFAMVAAGTISDYIGRKKVLIYAALLYAISALFSAVAPGYEVLVVARMIGGLAFGAALVLAPLYIAEVAPSEKRGKLVSVQQFNIVIGFSASYFCNYLLIGMMEEGTLTEYNVWRWMLGIEFLPALIYFACMFFVPKSPRWLLLHGREQEADAVLNKIFDNGRASEEKLIIKENIALGKKDKNTPLKSLFSSKLSLVMTIGFVVGIIQQVTGVNAIYFYAPTIFEQSGVGTNAAFAQAVLVGIINVVFTVVAMLTIDRLGRKPLLMAGLVGVVISMGITAYGFSQATYSLKKEVAIEMELDITKLKNVLDVKYENDISFKHELKTALGTAVYGRLEGDIIQQSITMNPTLILVGILLFVASFAVSLGPVMWVLLSEIFPNRIRGLAIAVVGFANAFSSFIVQLLFPWELTNLGNAGSFLVFGFFGLVGLLILSKILPETKGKTLEDIEKEYVR
ncbi:MAG: sugar porter family MFS transporter [Cyclobacteriaceae bacterium]